VGIATDHGGFGLREELDVDKQELGARRERLELPAIDREMLASIVDNFEKVMAEGPNPKKKHLLHRLVKKVLIQSRQTIEIWYLLPSTRRFADCNFWLAMMHLVLPRQEIMLPLDPLVLPLDRV
jgi:hypothetical protein